jgi:glycosyltransferase involved in cell wall biosynthesis
MKFSIVTPVKNEEQYIKETYQTIIKQGVDFEWLVLVDGYSTDKTVEILESIKDERIKIIKFPKDNCYPQCLYRRFNFALEKIVGDIFILIGGHDNFCENALKTIEKTIGDAEWLMGGFYKINPAGRVIRTFKIPAATHPFIKVNFIKKNNLRFVENYVCGDYEFQRHIEQLVGKPKIIPEMLTKVRIHESTIGSTLPEVKEEIKEIQRIYDKDAPKKTL